MTWWARKLNCDESSILQKYVCDILTIILQVQISLWFVLLFVGSIVCTTGWNVEYCWHVPTGARTVNKLAVGSALRAQPNSSSGAWPDIFTLQFSHPVDSRRAKVDNMVQGSSPLPPDSGRHRRRRGSVELSLQERVVYHQQSTHSKCERFCLSRHMYSRASRPSQPRMW